MSAAWRRVPFSPADAEAILAFCAQAPAGDLDRSLVRRLLLTGTSAPGGVLVYQDAEGLALVAVVIDALENGADAANLELLGGRPPVPRALFEELVVPDALAFARAGARAGLQVGVPALVDGADAALASLGFERAFVTCQMRRPAGAPPAPRPLRPGWRWAPLDDALAPAAHAALREAFQGAPSFNLGPLDQFRRAAPGIRPGWRLLCDGDCVAGLVQLVMHEAPRRHGELRTVARAPAYRGQGLGDELLVEALRVLSAAAAGEVELGAEVENLRALDLYRRFGFEVVSRLPWCRLRWR
jgi:ribosomal protein S18 acetylase RimI-like enzyme